MADKKKSIIPTIILSVISIIWIYPIVMILFNSLKVESAITTSGVFQFPTSETWNGIQNFIASVTQMDFLKSFWYSLVISVMSVVLILLCCSMCAWYIVRVNGLLSKVLYYLCVFSMVVPFQMVMFTLAKTADTLKLNNPYTICIVYLGFGAGLAVFMFTGFVKGSPLEIEEAAMIDGANRFQRIVHINLPCILPTIVIMLILQCGNLMSVGFEKVFLMQTPLNLEWSEIISTFVYKMGLLYTQYSFSTAVGLFNSVVNFILLMSVNLLSRRLSEYSLW